MSLRKQAALAAAETPFSVEDLIRTLPYLDIAPEVRERMAANWRANRFSEDDYDFYLLARDRFRKAAQRRQAKRKED